jgi:hypothetical protein
VDDLLKSTFCNFKQIAKRSSSAVCSSSKYCANDFFIWLELSGLLCAAQGRHKVSKAQAVRSLPIIEILFDFEIQLSFLCKGAPC